MPQCAKCRYVKKGDALHCNVYKEERKPGYVMFPLKECPSFCSDDILEIDVSGVKCDKIYGGIFDFFHTESYRDVVLNAVNLGGDTDTIAALAGGIAGIYYGFRSIPDNWVQNIFRKHEISDMISMFCRSVFRMEQRGCK